MIKTHHLLGDFDEFISGNAKFSVPVYCVWGNHEDEGVIKRLMSKELVVPNLHLVDANSDVLLDGWIRLAGVGGAFL